MDNWILEEVIESINLRMKAVKKVVDNKGCSAGYGLGKLDEMNFLKDLLDEINLMKSEDARQFEEAEEDYRENRYEAYI